MTLEEEGIPTALLTSLPIIAEHMNASRIVEGVKIPHPWGDPTLGPEKNRDLARTLFQRCLDLLGRDVERQEIVYR